jgi:DNA helicase-2/ATP-dependent DNA helicase PcrA
LIIIAGLQKEAETLNVHDLTAKAMDASGYMAALRAEKSQEAETRVENLMELLTVTQEFEQRSDDKSLRAFLEGISLMSDQDEPTENEDAVDMMTLLTAKGLEFPVDFQLGLEQGIIPHSRSLNEEKDLEEERRLAYVGITRAREELYLTYAHARQLYGVSQANAVSRFVGEIPKELLDDRRASRTPATPWAGTPRTGPSLWEQMQKRNVKDTPKRTARPASTMPFRPGQKVRHATFGEGVIVSAHGEGDTAQVSVAFPEAGVKKLLLAYAKLEKV